MKYRTITGYHYDIMVGFQHKVNWKKTEVIRVVKNKECWLEIVSDSSQHHMTITMLTESNSCTYVTIESHC